MALLTIGGAHVIADASWLDPIGGLIISAMVIRAGWQNTMSALLELGDVTIDQEIKDSVRRSTNKALTGDPKSGSAGVTLGEQAEIKDVQGIKSGQNYLVDIELAVPSTFTVAETSPIEQAIRERVGSKVRGVRKVRVRFTALEANHDFKSEFISANVSPRSSPEPEDEHDHEHNHHQHTNGHTHASGIKKNT